MTTEIPELLCPAGDMGCLRSAIHYGADAVYGGMKQYGLRAFAGNFDEPQLEEAVRLLHSAGKKFYLTMNIYPFDDQIDGFMAAAKKAYEIGVDAVIVSDIGAITMLRREIPQLQLHVSTQASTVNSAAVSHYHELGCSRVILAREVGLDRIRRMKENIPAGMELECFVHGAACMSYSGRCLLSAEILGRHGNQGACAQPCRWKYAVVEEKRPGVYFPVSEDENGTYIFSAKDLNMMPILPQLVESGVSSLKIEGRMKSEFYVATVTRAYRAALDLLRDSGREAFEAALPELMSELECCSHRDSDTGFMLSSPEVPAGTGGFSQTREFVGIAAASSSAGEKATIRVKNKITCGDRLEIMGAHETTPFTAGTLIREKTGETLDTFSIAEENIIMELPCPVCEGDVIRIVRENSRS